MSKHSVDGRLAAEQLDLPSHAHVPGRNARPHCRLLEEVAERAPAITRDRDSAENLPWRYGIRLFNEGFFWEAHEVLEPVWMRAVPNSRERHLVQAIIHLTNAALKARMQREHASQRLLGLAEASLDRARLPRDKKERLMGLQRDELDLTQQAIRTARHAPTLLERFDGGAGQ